MKNNTIIKSLKKEQKRLEGIISKIEAELVRAPEGNVLVKRYKKGVQFYYRNDPKDRNGTYMPVEDRKRAVALVQKRYKRRLLPVAKIQKKAIDTFLKVYNPDALKEVFEKEGALRQLFLNPVELPDAQYAADWEKADYTPKSFYEDTPVHLTQKQERVRSKSEVMIANALCHAKIPYHYECPLNLGNQIIHPDFTILRMRDRKEIYWEHLGMIDDTEYRNNALKRIREYENHGIFPGDRLIITVESSRMPLNTAVVESMIENYLK